MKMLKNKLKQKKKSDKRTSCKRIQKFDKPTYLVTGRFRVHTHKETVYYILAYNTLYTCLTIFKRHRSRTKNRFMFRLYTNHIYIYMNYTTTSVNKKTNHIRSI